jgi:hypothetical protein
MSRNVNKLHEEVRHILTFTPTTETNTGYDTDD